MLNRYQRVAESKTDIQKFVSLVKEDFNCNIENSLTSIAKNILFIRRVYYTNNHQKKYYYERLNTNMFELFENLHCKTSKYFYSTLRETIENFVRVILELENYDKTGVRNIFAKLKQYYYKDSKIIIDYIEGEYGKCCDYVHGNINADLPMYEYYEQLTKKNKLSNEQVKTLVSELQKFFSQCKNLVIEIDTQKIDSSFYNEKELLSYLIGKDYGVYKKNVLEFAN